MIQAVIFDMDGLLIDSEPLWEDAELKVFHPLGVPLTREMTSQTMGMIIQEVVGYWYQRYPWEGKSQEEVAQEIIQNVIALVKEKGEAREGVYEILDLLKKENFPIAIASSSQMAIIDAVVEKLQIKDKIDVIHSAEHEEFGKPHPGVYLTTAKKLGIAPENCLAFEDSPNGVRAAKAAEMTCIAVPDQKVKGDKRFAIADKELASLKDFKLEMLDAFA